MKMHPVVIKSRDGLDLVSYLSLPQVAADPDGDGKPNEPLPMVLDVHGGRGRATTGASTPSINCWPIAATRC